MTSIIDWELEKLLYLRLHQMINRVTDKEITSKIEKTLTLFPNLSTEEVVFQIIRLVRKREVEPLIKKLQEFKISFERYLEE